jgi:murein DD-endopeptidase MepM/ murein hydrolase activator NlpD
MLTDFNPPPRPAGHLLWRRLLPLILLSCFAGTGVWAAKLIFGQYSDRSAASVVQTASVSSPEDCIKTVKGCIKLGESMSSILDGKLSPKEMHELTLKCRTVFPLTKICAGQPYKLSLKEGDFERFAYDIDSDEQLIIRRDEEGFDVSRKPINYAVKLVTIKGDIESSLFGAMIRLGESEGLAVQLAHIFAWDIDFFHDVQPGDSFEMLVEKRFRKGRPAGNGRLLAAKFTNRGRVYQAFYFQDGDRPADYYNEKGRSLRKAFLKAPLSFSRISSGFSMHRLNPVTHRYAPHPAIDFAAPTGTPIHTVGSGTVLFAAYKRFNGNCVKVRHPNGWVTMYNHMCRFARHIRRGSKVRQGQVIGYVGTTGRSTGPHLDFRIYRRGVPVNPLKVKSPPARPVSRANMAAFKAITVERLTMLDNGKGLQTARADSFPVSAEPASRSKM